MNWTKYSAWVEHIWGYGKKLKPSWHSDYIMTVGLGGETGEVLEVLKKHARARLHNPRAPLDREHLKEELGDTLYMLVKIANRYDIPMEEVVTYNVMKLNLRYDRRVAKRKRK